MFLLNSLLITEHLDSEDGILSIENFISKNLQHTFYYFRLGRESNSNKRNKYLSLSPEEFTTITTCESFHLSKKILGIFGQSSEYAMEGLQVLHSPFIDPGFFGPLTLGVKNCNNIEIILEYNESKIGKVCFFDISDTYPINIKKTSSFYRRFLDSQE